MVSRAATALYSHLTSLTDAAASSAAYFYSSPKLKRCLHGVATARRCTGLTSSLANWPVLGGIQPGTAAAAVWSLSGALERSPSQHGTSGHTLSQLPARRLAEICAACGAVNQGCWPALRCCSPSIPTQSVERSLQPLLLLEAARDATSKMRQVLRATSCDGGTPVRLSSCQRGASIQR